MAWNMEEALDYYRSQGAPADQNALKNLLQEVQEENGGAVPGWVLPRIAEAYGLKESFLRAIIARFPRLRLENSHCLELCGGGSCGRKGKLLDFVEKTYGAHPDAFSLRVVPCMHMCGQGPIVRWDGEVHCGADEALIRALAEGTAPAAAPAPEKPKEKQKDKEKEKKKDKKKDEKKDEKDRREKKGKKDRREKKSR